MTVKELIEDLKLLNNQDAPVYFVIPLNGQPGEYVLVTYSTGDNLLNSEGKPENYGDESVCLLKAHRKFYIKTNH